MTAAGWREVSLGEVLAENRQRVAVEPAGEYPAAGVYGFGRGVLLREPVTGADISASHLYRIAAGQVIYSRLKAFEGAFAVVPAEADGRFVSNEFPTFDVDPEAALPGFIGLLLARPQLWAEMSERITGVGARRERLQICDFLDTEVVLPPLPMQELIVGAAAAADEIVTTSRREAESAFRMLAAAVEEELAAADAWADIPDGWRLMTLEDVSDLRSGITKGRKTNDLLVSAPFIRAANVQGGYLNLGQIKTIEVTPAEIERFALAEGDVLLVEGGNAEHVGRGWLWSAPVAPCLHQNHVFRARPDRQLVEPRFLAYAINATPAREYCFEQAKRTTNLASINKTQISKLPVPVPPLDAQRRILERLDAIRAVAVAAQREADAAAVLRAGWVDEMLVGGHLPATRQRVGA